MPPTTALADCARLVTNAQEAGGRAPKALTNILAGAHLLNAHSAAPDPAQAIVASAAAGQLTAAKLTTLLTEATTAASINSYRAELRQRAERLFTQAFHDALRGGCADELIDSMRPVWDEHAAAIDAAKMVIPAESSTDHFLASTTDPNAIQTWQSLNEHLRVISAIAGIASQFGCRTGNFPMIAEYANADGFRLDDRALRCTGGPLVTDSAAFRSPDQGHRTSPWFRLPLRLHSTVSAQARYDEWASSEWERAHAGPATSWIDEHGHMHEMPRPENPFKTKAKASAT